MNPITQRLVPRLAALLAAPLTALVIGAPSALAADGAGLPAGATSLRETCQDWTVACVVRDKTKHWSFCVVSVAFDTAAAKALRAGKTLKLIATRSDNDQPFSLSVPLAGFGAAMDRTAALVK